MNSKVESQCGKAARHRGFTLIELMIVVAIVAIFSAVALPAYQGYVLRGRISDGQSALAAFSTSMQQYYQDNRTFAGACGTSGVGALPTASTYFTYSCSNLGATSFLATATGTGAASGFTFTVDQDGNRQTTAVPSGWTSSTTCWVRNSSGSCN